MDVDFAEPDWQAPLDLERRIAAVPKHATVKGMFLADLQKHVRVAGHALANEKRYTAFRDYPLTEWLELAVTVARLVHPREPVRRALWMLGRRAYSTFTDSLAGRVVMSAAGHDVALGIRLVPKVYQVTGSARVRIVSLVEGEAVLELEESWDFPDCYGVGVFHGGLEAFGVVGNVTVRSATISTAQLRLRWTAR